MAIVPALLLLSRAAHAQATGQDVATAQALFDEGKRLMAANNHAEACPKLVESQRLDPGGGTLFAIALCHEAEGKTATAWADYTVALAEARKDGRKDREQAAADRVKGLEPRLTRLRIVITQKTPGLELMRDGGLVGEAQWGLALPIDPGEHAFTARAPGKVEWKDTFDVRGEGRTVDVTIPALNDAPKPPAAPALAPVTVPPPPTSERPPAEPSMQKTWAIVAGTAGLVSIGVGLGFGFAATSKWSDAEAACPNNRCTNPADTTLGDDAGAAADVSTVLVGLGAGAVLAGVILWLTAPRDSSRGVRIAPTVAKDTVGVSLGGWL